MSTFDKSFKRAMDAAGPTISIKELRVGDTFETAPTRAKAATDGTIDKIGRTKITSSKLYMGRIPTTIELSKRDLIGGKVLRDGIVYSVIG